MDFVKSFVIGSSAPTFVPFYFAVTQIPEKKFSAQGYPVKASLYFGFMNTISKILGEMFSLTLFQRLFIINLISIIFVISWITIRQSYDFETRERWLQQYAMIALGHSATYLGTIQVLETIL